MFKHLAIILGVFVASSAWATTEYNVTCDVNDTISAQRCDYDIGPIKVNVNSWGVPQRLWVTGDDSGAGRTGMGLDVDMSISGTNMVGLYGVLSEPLSTAVGTTHLRNTALLGRPRAYNNHTLTYLEGLNLQLIGSSGATITNGWALDIAAPSLSSGATIGNLAAINVAADAGMSYFNFPLPSGGAGVLNIAPSPSQLETFGTYYTGTNNAANEYWAQDSDMFYAGVNGTIQGFARDTATISNSAGAMSEYASFLSKPSALGAGSVSVVDGFKTGGTLASKTFTRYYGLNLTSPSGGSGGTKYGFASNFSLHGLGTMTPTTLLQITRAAAYAPISTVLIDGSLGSAGTSEGLTVTTGTTQSSGTGGHINGISGSPTINGSGGSIASTFGINGTPIIAPANTTSVGNAIGGTFTAVSNITGGNTTLVSNAYGVYINTPGPEGTISNKYGLVVEAGAGTNGIGTTTPLATLTVGEGHLQHSGTPPTPSSCGSGPAISGTDNAFRVSAGSGTVVSCTITFATTWTNAPICIVQDADGTNVHLTTTSGTTLVIEGPDFASDSLAVLCSGWE